jgi:uncharacterized membrane protein YqgA involved in biofilm formation
MALDFWAKTSGTWINIFTVLLGTTIGLILSDRLPQRMQQIITHGIGLITIWIGLTMASTMTKVQAGEIDGAILGLIAIVLGGISGGPMKLYKIGQPWQNEHFYCQ